MKEYEKPAVAAAVNDVAKKLNIPVSWLVTLIQKESRWNPTIKNPLPKSSARGLIQIIDSTARDLGYSDSLEIISMFPDSAGQLREPVYNYLRRYAPFTTNAELYLSVFYPAWRKRDYTQPFPENVQKANPGIITPAHYVAYVEGRLSDYTAGKFDISEIVRKNTGYSSTQDIAPVNHKTPQDTQHIAQNEKKNRILYTIAGLTVTAAFVYYWKK